MTFSRRSRVISVRVSQEEYEEVERLSRERGAHSVPDFVRRVLTTWQQFGAGSELCSSGILEQVAALQRKVDWLSGLVVQIRGERATDSTESPSVVTAGVSPAAAPVQAAQKVQPDSGEPRAQVRSAGY